MSNSIKPGIIEAISRIFNVPESNITDQSGYGDFEEWDSIGHLRLMMELEAVFSVRFSTDEINKQRNVASLCALVSEQIPGA